MLVIRRIVSHIGTMVRVSLCIKTHTNIKKVDLPGSWSVWAATPHAAFLHGRFVWASWDVEELAQMKKEFSDPGFLQFGLQGIPPVSLSGFLAMA